METKTAIVARGDAMPPASTPQEVLALAINKGVDPGVLKQLLDVQERWEANEAAKAYTKAIAAFKREAPAVLAKDAKVDFTNKAGQRTHYKHATLGSIVQQLTGKLSDHGLSVSFSCAQEGNSIAVTCQITHERGHSEHVTLAAPRDESGNKNPIQMICSAVTYLERYTLLAALGLATADQDDDGIASGARNGGGNGEEGPVPDGGNSAGLPSTGNFQPGPDHSSPAAPACPKCGGPTVERANKKTGSVFYGCRKYPECKGIAKHASEATAGSPSTPGTPDVGAQPSAADLDAHMGAPGSAIKCPFCGGDTAPVGKTGCRKCAACGKGHQVAPPATAPQAAPIYDRKTLVAKLDKIVNVFDGSGDAIWQDLEAACAAVALDPGRWGTLPVATLAEIADRIQ